MSWRRDPARGRATGQGRGRVTDPARGRATGQGRATGRGRGRDRVYDIVTPTEGEARAADLARRRRRYFALMAACLTLVVFGFFVPAPAPVRVAALVVAAVLLPVAAIVGNARGGR